MSQADAVHFEFHQGQILGVCRGLRDMREAQAGAGESVLARSPALEVGSDKVGVTLGGHFAVRLILHISIVGTAFRHLGPDSGYRWPETSRGLRVRGD